MEVTQVKANEEMAKDWEFVCMGCGRVVFSMASAAKALYCRHCQTELLPLWFPINVPRYAVPFRLSAECPYCWESLVITLPSGKVPFSKVSFTCRHCLGKVTVNFRKHPITLKRSYKG